MKKQTDILIIGGGFGGVAAGQKLSENGVDVTLIDKKDYFEVTFATLRNVANPKLLGNTPRKKYSDFFKGEFIQAGVESMNEKEATLSNGEVIGFNKAIIATGSRYPSLPQAKSNSAFSYAERNQELLDDNKALAAAQSVLVIGGGLVGVEFAGEIASAYPNKDITLAHASDTLLVGSKPKVQRKALEQLNARGVTVKFNRRFAKDGDLYRCSVSGETIQPDIAYLCVGMVPNTEFLKAELPSILNERELIKVDANMQVEGYDSLFALGDCSTLDDRKHGYLASVQGGQLADNLLKAPKSYGKPPLMIVTTTGIDTGVATLPIFDLTSTLKFIINLKKDMGVKNIFKLLGVQPDPLG